ncbi:hypothetical protein [Rubinisphaera margarita]|uniref:hypothetical protein n=1 Tax=Rubinisphaera margarita TaxID=2909586 RepID=UPI001EE7F552|nr:hypothetical protein [Rubinisphaera margarita]MCG6158380.1 hypothetical protein [Rubinisphaera margarita]
MNETHSPAFKREQLLAQDATTSNFNYEEFRMQLQNRISHLEKRARQLQKAMWISAGVLILCFPAVLIIEAFRLTEYPWVLPLWSGIGMFSMFLAAVFSGVYSARYRPLLKRAQYDLQLSMITELQTQVAEINRKLAER